MDQESVLDTVPGETKPPNVAVLALGRNMEEGHEPNRSQLAHAHDLAARARNFSYTRADLRDLFLGEGPSYESLMVAHAEGIQATSASLLTLLFQRFQHIQDANIEEHIRTAVSYSFFGLGHGMDEQVEAASLLFLSIWILDDCVMDSGEPVDRAELTAFTKEVKRLWNKHLVSPSYQHKIESSTIYDIVLFLLDRHLTLLKQLDIAPHFLAHHRTAFEFYLDSLTIELAFRALSRHPYDAYKAIRLRSSGMKFSMTLMVLLKSIAGDLLPTFSDPKLNRAIERSALYASLFNDIVSYPRESTEDVVNSVRILMDAHDNDI
ncbi:MAG: hypothetical protein KDK70_20845, partial [Myxococcales bacterium]|nr:hypothetical protein [Myxococcales bacterium]